MIKVILAISALITVMITSAEVEAAYTHHSVKMVPKYSGVRSEKMESTFVLSYNQSADSEGYNDTSLSLDSEVAWGFTLGYNLNSHILFNYEFNYARPDYTAEYQEYNPDFPSLPGRKKTINHTMDMITNQFSGTYNFSQERFTPYIQAGLGWTYIDSNVVNGPGYSGCYWDPWYPYPICGTYYNTYSSSRFSYNGAIGLRYDMPNSAIIKASYGAVNNDIKSTDNLLIGIFKLEIGSTF